MRRTVLFVLLLAIAFVVKSQSFTNRGKEFYTGYVHHVNMEIENPIEYQEMVLYFSAEEAAHVVVTLEGTAYREEYDVPANSVIRSKIIPRGLNGDPPSQYDARLYTKPASFGGTSSEGHFTRKGIHIVSNMPIVAYAHLYSQASSSASMLIPVESWGYSYKALTIKQTVTEFDDDRFSWMFVVASRNNTRIRITPSVPTRTGKPANVPIEVTLQKGDIYQLLGGAVDKNNIYNLSGTTVQSIPNSQGECYPVATFMGASGVHVSCPGFTGRFPPEDNLFQQMFPIQAWGQRYLTTPTSQAGSPASQNPNLFRVLVKDPATVVKRNGVVLSGAVNSTYEFFSSTSDYIEADNPISVAQAIPSTGACNYVGDGDPDLIYISPIEQGIKRTGFFLNEKNAINWNFVSLVIPTAGLSSLTIDGSSTFSHSYPHPNLPGYSVVVNRWRSTIINGQCIIKSDSAFTGITYGLGNAETYAYNIGSYLNNLSGIAEIRNSYNTADTANSYTCANTPLKLSVLMRYKPVKMHWRLSELDGIISPATDVLNNAPIPDGETLVNGVTYFRYTLPGEYRFLKDGTHIVPLFTTHATVEGCDNTEQIQYEVVVKAGLKSDFEVLYENCKQAELIRFEADATYTDGSPIDRWEWTFTDQANSWNATGQQVSRQFTAGEYTARLIAVDKNACVADTFKVFRLSANPVIPEIISGSADICSGIAVTLKEKNPEAGVKEWYWDFGDGNKATPVTDGFEQVHTFSKPGKYTIKHVTRFSANCISDTASMIIDVYGPPQVNIEFPNECLAADGRVQFLANTTAPGGQSIASHAWDFGDAAATPANPNTSNLNNPVHSFVQGSYNIKYRAVTDRGCFKDTSFTAQFNLKPVLSFQNPATPPVCENLTTPVTIAAATVTNNVPGTGSYRGPGVTSEGKLVPSIARAGVHTIWYIYTTSAGCSDSVSSTVTIYPQPKAGFQSSGDVCLDQQVLLSDSSSISNQPAGTSMVKWTWSFGDGSASIINSTGQDINHQFSASGKYQVQLIVESDKGCVSEPFNKEVNIHSLPVASFDLPGVICMPGGDAVFTNKSTLDESVKMTYQWNFGDGQSSSLENGRNRYANAGNYQVELTATSALGCSSQVTNQLPVAVFKERPIAAFDVTPDRICQGTENVFTDKSTGNTINNWTWTFGDGSSSTAQNPVKRYGSYGEFEVTLKVTSSDGCESDLLPGSARKVTVLVQPIIDAGPDIHIAEGSLVTLQATANNESALRFLWNPSGEVSNPGILRPSFHATHDQMFRLTATGGDGECTATDSVWVKILRPVKVPNVFSPNGDGINDRWVITNLSEYKGCTIEVFNRYGQLVYSSTGYGSAWDGTRNGNPLPVGTYYYVIRLKNGFGILKGSVTILR